MRMVLPLKKAGSSAEPGQTDPAMSATPRISLRHTLMVKSERVADLAAPIVQSRIGRGSDIAGAIDSENIVAVRERGERDHRDPRVGDGVAERAADVEKGRAAEPGMAQQGVVLDPIV